MAKAADFRNLSPEELNEKLNGLKKESMQKRFQAKTGKLERHCEIQQVQKDIARVMTVMNEKKFGSKS